MLYNVRKLNELFFFEKIYKKKKIDRYLILLLLR